ncbi:GspE/PulE family protein [Paraburkholderia hospita]|uniref:Type II secretion system protein E n=1 Tax=Paraburkholderia hospita TaxID=169430 RepID=A0AAN1JKH7_9BURK|nr:GspE/PulE family protein [Paraburkholderia hospita]EUC12010.1 type II secretion system protein E [Burkholderia sp. BT03]AUT74973.1 type II/IV secretion system protein [Paraburkholderia hospita]EIM94872.1 type II secretion system protein E [Paraburkholderia hospita]OUL74862.1 general secretion pathway protein GspE [Paraburkholderia hospita]OUL84193.1 general secretion pathway protein GspE [Paraburkholderia hospita]
MNAPETIAPLFDADLLARARAAAAATQRHIVAELETLTGVEPRQLLQALAQLLDMRVIETADMLALKPAFDRVPLSRAMQRRCVLLRDADASFVGVVTSPFDLDLQTWLAAQANAAIDIRLALPSDLQAYHARMEESTRAIDSLVTGGSEAQAEGRTAQVLSFETVSEAASPAVKLVNSTLYDALKAGASDIHLESTPSGLALKYRVDGVLDAAATLNGVETAEQVISRLKVLAELDIAERRVPQDGSFRVAAGGRDIDLRVSIMPSIHGEDAVIRILDKRAMIEAYGSLTLEALGYDSESLVALRALAEEPYGMLLVTGPTGSGKTTTLYAALTEIHNGRDKIITIEDPVEYQLPGILQIPVNEKKGLTFARGLRSILRHDPDKIMVGEIRDRETAEIAVQSALTGHLVLTTVHANNVFDVFGRFSHMGIDPYAFVSALNGIWAQRLMRVNCAHCAAPYMPTDAELARLGLSRADVAGFDFRQGTGCGDCRGTGYRGRRAIAEILILDDEIRDMVVEKQPIRAIKDVARKNGTRRLRDVALNLVKRGETTLAEVKRVTLNA